jgi:hypothetical protein
MHTATSALHSHAKRLYILPAPVFFFRSENDENCTCLGHSDHRLRKESFGLIGEAHHHQAEILEPLRNIIYL